MHSNNGGKTNASDTILNKNKDHVVLDLIKKIPVPIYFGYTDKKTPQEFIKELIRYAKAKGIEHSVIVERVLPVALKGKAAEWFEFMGGFTDWEKFQTGLQDAFGPADYKDALKRELEARTQHPN